MQVHRNRHTHAYVQIPNRIARHTSLSLEARGLLTYLLSLPDANGATVERITSSVPNGRRSVGNAMNELIAHGYVKRARVQDPESGRWVTLTTVTDSPTDHMLTVGEPTPQAVGCSPKGEKNPKGNDLPTLPEQPAAGAESLSGGEETISPQNQQEAPATADAVIGRAAACLSSVGRVEPMLRLSVRDSLRLAPLAAQWLSDGFEEMEVIKALTRSLPASVESAAAFISYRLKNQPEKIEPLPLAPKAPPVRREHCPECEVIFPLGHLGGICRNCR
ncbi:helix-turn-helix domain-containing protein [Streptomyces sp. NPDC047525]|uniref:helix-turn-helix domain-containing protein n=1 Tax=Streptomyces sp. NPDC047525 TaxID=3155264 RepID=UPI00340CCA52